MKIWIPALLAAALAAAPAQARDDDDDRPRQDEIILHLQSEAWVETRTAKVVAVVQTVLAGEEAGRTTTRLPGVLNELVPDADWRVVSFDRTRDASGLERWIVTAEARLPEPALGGIYDRARTLSRPGQQVDIREIDFSPTLAEREATAGRLRGEIYRRAAEEAGKVAEVWPDRGFRVHRVDFAYGGIPAPVPMPRQARAAIQESFAPPPADAGMGVMERMVLTATVILAAALPEEKTEK